MQVENTMHLLEAGCGICGPTILKAQQFDVNIDAITISETPAKISQDKILKLVYIIKYLFIEKILMI